MDPITLTAAAVVAAPFIGAGVDSLFTDECQRPAYELVQHEGRKFMVAVCFEDIATDRPVAVVKAPTLLRPAGYP